MSAKSFTSESPRTPISAMDPLGTSVPRPLDCSLPNENFWRRHALDISVVCSIVELFVACALNLIIIICYCACSLLAFASHNKHSLPYNMAACSVAYLVTVD